MGVIRGRVLFLRRNNVNPLTAGGGAGEDTRDGSETARGATWGSELDDCLCCASDGVSDVVLDCVSVDVAGVEEQQPMIF